MQQKQLIIQKIAVIGSFILSSLAIVYALGYATQIAHLRYFTDPNSARFYVPGSTLFLDIQDFNRELFNVVLLLFVICLTMFITLTHKRRLYYISNYITTLVYALYSSYVAIGIITQNMYYKNRYLSIGFERFREVSEVIGVDFVNSTLMLDLGFVLAYALLAFAALLILSLVMKIMWTKQEKWIVEEVKVEN